VHILNVSFLVPGLRRDFGGCAGNIAYSLNALGGTALPMAAVGSDGADYVARLQGLGIGTEFIREIDDTYTAQCFITTDLANNQITAFHPGAMQQAHATITTDLANNQITAFHPGAMQQAHATRITARDDIQLGIISPDGRDAMLQHAEQFKVAGIPFVFDPGQGLPMFNGDELARFIEQADWVTVNDYEGKMLSDRTGWDNAEISRRVRGLVVTLGADGCDVWVDGQCTHVPAVTPEAVVDPTGCGDAWRGALLFGLEKGWALVDCAALGNRVGALKIAQRGPQNYQLDRQVLGI
jgi:adenosine kinase